MEYRKLKIILEQGIFFDNYRNRVERERINPDFNSALAA